MKLADGDDRPGETLGLAHPKRRALLAVNGGPVVHLDQVHAFLWLTLKYQWAGRDCQTNLEAEAVRRQSLRLLNDWLAGADFAEKAIH